MNFYKFLPGNQASDQIDFVLLLLHFLGGILIYYFPDLSVVYGIGILVFGVLYIFLSKDQQFQTLQMVAYLSGAEVFLRMTHGNLLYEYGRHGVIVFLLLGILFNGFHQKARGYILFLVLLIPGIAISQLSANKTESYYLVYVLIGPIVTALCALYTFRKSFQLAQLHKILFLFLCPLIACISYLILDYPVASDIFFNMESNFLFTGNFGPNQMATVLGLGVFILLARLLLTKTHQFYVGVYLMVMLYMFYRGLLTFSRGGMIVCVIVSATLIFVLLKSKNLLNDQIKSRIKLSGALGILVFGLLAFQSEGFIIKRYGILVGLTDRNDDSKVSRSNLMAYEMKLFSEHPVLGAGIGKGIQGSLDYFGKRASSHNEITRLLAEHGFLGLAAFLLLLLTPLFFYNNHGSHVYFWSFYFFWLFTIMHSGLRIAAPSFIYALTLLKVNTNNNHSS